MRERVSSGGKRIASNSVILIAAEFFRKIMRMLLVIFSARLLGDEVYGQFSFAIAFTTLFWICADMGISLLLTREVARKPEQAGKYVGSTLVAKIGLSVITILLICGIVQFTKKPPEVLASVYIMGFVIVSMSMVDFFKAVFHAFQEMKHDAVATFLESVIIAVAGIGVLLLRGGLIALSAVYLGTYLITLVYCVWVIVRKYCAIALDPDWPVISYFLREGFPIGINYFFTTMYTLVDTVMLSLMVGDQVVGWYNAAYRLILGLEFISMGIIKSVFPALSKYFQDGTDRFEALFRKTFKIMMYIGIFLATLVSLTADKVILFFFDVEFLPAADALRVLIWGMALIFVTLVMTHATRASNRQRFTAKVVGFCAFFNLVLNFILIPRFGFLGAAYATLGTEMLSFIIHAVYFRLRLVDPPVFRFLPKLILMNGGVAGIIFLFPKLDLFITYPLAALVYAGLTFMLRFFSKDELSVFLELWESVLKRVKRPKTG